jgi:hypothetical protein
MLVLGPTGLMRGGLRGLCAGFDEVARGCDPSTQVFAMTYKFSIENTELLLLHLALVTPTGTAAGNARILDERWGCIGKASDPAIAIAERVRRYWTGPDPDLSCVFVQGEWLGKDTSCGNIVTFPVVTPEQHWFLISDYEEDIVDQTERDWATLTGNDGCVHAAYFQFFPVQAQGFAVGP